MKSRKLICVAASMFTIVPIALASSKWYVDGVRGSDNNNCQSRQHACKTISNAISLTLPGDSIFVAPATYHEGLVVPFTLKIIGSGAKTTIVDAGGVFGQALVVGSEPRVPVTAPPVYPVGTGSSEIRSSIAPNRRRFRCLSASSNPHA